MINTIKYGAQLVFFSQSTKIVSTALCNGTDDFRDGGHGYVAERVGKTIPASSTSGAAQLHLRVVPGEV